ncbi:MAG: sulfatase-like hydrolase/transferase [Flavobacteriales bacterium]
MKKIIYISITTLLFITCKKETDSAIDCGGITATKPNILLIIADDMGLDACPSYPVGTVKPNMPNLQQMINTGVRYNNFWSYPVCTPTRSSILTGKHGFRTNMLNVGDVLSTSETSLQSHIGSSYANAIIGKWHLGNSANHPTDMGVDYYAGLLSGAAQSYTNWRLTENGASSTSNDYITTKITDLAINWKAAQTKPWFLWLAYTAPHTPFHFPDTSLHSQGMLPTDAASIAANPLPYYMAMLEAMDHEMGRFLNTMSQEEKENTIIIFIGDNGSPNEVVQQYRSQRAKGTVYQGGINTPMIVSGANVSRINQTDDAFVGTVDLFATIADLAGTGTTEIHDSKSFKRTFSEAGYIPKYYNFSEIRDLTTSNTDYTIRNATHKYIMFEDGDEALFNLSANPFENPNLMAPMRLPLSSADSTIKAELEAEVLNIRM